MKTNCEFCGSIINDSDEKCPNCGSTNAHFRKTAPEQPKTIEELQLWYKEKNLPPENVTRFFIGKDVKDSKAFGIYHNTETNTYVVYKNKADGSRAVRYDGSDEEYAVNEIFQKLREIMSEQKANNKAKASKKGSSKPSTNYSKKKRTDWGTNLLIGGTVAGILGISAVVVAVDEAKQKSYFKDHPNYNQYYEYDGDYYYNLDGQYYLYDNDSEAWNEYSGTPFDEDDYENYTISGSYDDYDLANFEDTDYYTNWYDDFYNSSDNDNGGGDNNWDNGWDSNDDWDSDGGDWDSDW